MAALLDGMQIIEGSAFVAAPSGAMTLAQLGADVVRFDQIGGGLDAGRWPLTNDGQSLYWAGLNKGKRSLAVNLRDPVAHELLGDLIASAGTCLTNFATTGWMAPEALQRRRDDLVVLAITGNRDGSTAVDYTVNCAMGFPMVTGPVDATEPVNHVLPAWDLICGQTAALALLAADRRRLLTGAGAHLRLALSDVALAAVAALGYIGEAQINGIDRPRHGNDLYGAFGAQLTTADRRHVYVVGISSRQWDALVTATEAGETVAAIADRRDLDFADEGDRFAARHEIKEAMQHWIGARSFSEVAAVLDHHGVCWGPYQTFRQLTDHDPRCSAESGLFRQVDQPGIGSYLVPASPVLVDGAVTVEPAPAPVLGQHTDEILSERLALTAAEIGRLHDQGVVAGPQSP